MIVYCHYSVAISFLDLDRDKMIALAYLTGSDYTEGVHGMLKLFLYGVFHIISGCIQRIPAQFETA